MITVPTFTGTMLVYFYGTVFIYMYVTGREEHINYNPTQEFVIKVSLPYPNGKLAFFRNNPLAHQQFNFKTNEQFEIIYYNYFKF